MSTEAFIMLIVGLVIALGGAALLLSTGDDIKQQLPESQEDPNLRLLQVLTQNISNGSAGHVRISFTADRPIKLTDAEIVLRTETEAARLQYRNGTLNRSVVDGFYTQ